MTHSQFNRMRDLQAIDALDEHFPLCAEERAELVYLEMLERFSKHKFSDSDWIA